MTLLLIDDDELILDCLSELLVTDGHQVHTASSGGECIALISNGVHPDIIITDYRLHHLYGIEAVKSIRSFLGKEIPAIIYTDDESEEARDAVRQNKCIFLRRLQVMNTLTSQVKKMFA